MLIILVSGKQLVQLNLLFKINVLHNYFVSCFVVIVTVIHVLFRIILTDQVFCYY